MGLFRHKRKEHPVCPNCKKPVPDGTVFCNGCGLRILPPPACSKCGIPLAPDTNFCESCGTPVGAIPSYPSLPDASTRSEPASSKKHSKGKKGRKKNSSPCDHSSNPPIPAAGDDEPVFPEEPSIPALVEAEKGSGMAPPVPEKSAIKRPLLSSSRTIAFIGLLLAGSILVVVLIQSGIVHGAVKQVSGAALPAGYVNVNDTLDNGSQVFPTKPGTSAPSLIPQPTQVPPDNLIVWFQTEKDPVTHNVSVLFQGGKGQLGVREVFVRLTRSDTKVIIAVFKPVAVGEGIEVPGTKYTDRLEVIVTYNTGAHYTIIDRLFEYKMRN